MVQYLHGSCKATSAVIVSVLRPVSTEAQQTRTLSARHLPIALKRRVELTLNHYYNENGEQSELC